MKRYRTSHLIKSEDLNHHGTLFAGRSAEWLVESGFICAAATHGKPQDVLCINIHGFVFKTPVKKGELLMMTSVVARVGTTSITVYIKAENEITGVSPTDGFITFVTVDTDTENKVPHGIVLDETDDPEELTIRKRALDL